MLPSTETTTAPRSKTVHVTSKKQATWLKSIMRGKARASSSKLVELQIVTRPGTSRNPPQPEDILATYSKEDALSPMEATKRHGAPHPETGILQSPVVFWSRKSEDDPTVSTAITQDERTAEAFKKPASEDCILAHLMRLATFLTVKGTAKDAPEGDPQALFILSDYTVRLQAEKTREVDLFLACEYFIETEEDGFFPTIARLLKQVKKEATS